MKGDMSVKARLQGVVRRVRPAYGRTIGLRLKTLFTIRSALLSSALP